MSAKSWSVKNSLDIYQIERWGQGFFGVDKSGDLCVYPEQTSNGPVINIAEVIKEAQSEGLKFPAVFRFHEILHSQIKNLNETFSKTIKDAKYNGRYFGVYPTKVNQLREVVEEIVEAGSQYDYGLEAGSKAELMAALAYNTNKNSLTILNGHKDREYMKLAFLGTTIGKKIVIVIEKLSEIHIVLELSKELNLTPIIGVRAKLNSKASGKWSESSGEHAKFGLSVSEIIELTEILKKENKLEFLELFHFHVGSQIPDIRTIKECINEGARIFTNLVKMGVPLKYFDVGGGVGVDYDGLSSATGSSTNYSISDYVGDVVYILKDICDVMKVPHPNIVSETGRAVAAHHSCVITKVFGEVKLNQHKEISTVVEATDHLLLRNSKILFNELSLLNYQDSYNDASLIKEEVIAAFKLGVLDLKERALAETLYWNTCHKIIHLIKDEENVPQEIRQLKSTLADKYLCNFSLFQSAPDSWAIGQILPIVPISRLNEYPERECTLADITCDSDGKINRFLGAQEHSNTLPIHSLKSEEDYFIGFFLTGAYQDVMGDMHNLFGRLNEVHVFSDANDPTNFYIEEIVQGNSSAQVLEIMQYNATEMSTRIKKEIDQKIKQGQIKPRSGVKLVDFYEECLKSYTYLS